MLHMPSQQHPIYSLLLGPSILDAQTHGLLNLLERADEHLGYIAQTK